MQAAKAFQERAEDVPPDQDFEQLKARSFGERRTNLMYELVRTGEYASVGDLRERREEIMLKLKPFLQSVRELGGESNEATVEEDTDREGDGQTTGEKSKLQTVDTVGNIESPPAKNSLNNINTNSNSNVDPEVNQQKDFEVEYLLKDEGGSRVVQLNNEPSDEVVLQQTSTGKKEDINDNADEESKT